jgi:hypothetical protein
MRSIVFEESMLNDPRFITLWTLAGRRSAIGMIVDACFLNGFYREKGGIPVAVWKVYGLEPMLEALLAIEVPDEIGRASCRERV